jgi:RNA polymerase sigma factor (sigma-70 family)
MHDNKLSDQQLGESVASGDRAAFIILRNRYQAAVKRLALSIVHDEAVSDTVTQQAFAYLWTHGDAFTAQHRPFKTWFLAVVRRLAMDALTQEWEQPATSEGSGEVEKPIEDSLELPGNVSEADWPVFKEANDALAALSFVEYHLTELAYFQGTSWEEIAQVTPYSAGEVYTQVCVAVRKLREAIQTESDHPYRPLGPASSAP